jgi:hypothetical protein
MALKVEVSGLRSAPISEHFLGYSPAQAMSLAPDSAIQIVLARKGKLSDTPLGMAA